MATLQGSLFKRLQTDVDVVLDADCDAIVMDIDFESDAEIMIADRGRYHLE